MILFKLPTTYIYNGKLNSLTTEHNEKINNNFDNYPTCVVHCIAAVAASTITTAATGICWVVSPAQRCMLTGYCITNHLISAHSFPNQMNYIYISLKCAFLTHTPRFITNSLLLRRQHGALHIHLYR